MALRHLYLAAVATLTLAACSDLVGYHQSEKVAARSFPGTTGSETAVVTYDELLARIAKEAPGYGGHFLGDDGVPRIVIVGPESHILERIEAARTVLSRHMSLTRKHPPLRPVELDAALPVHGKYNFEELYEWKKLLAVNVLGMDGIAGLDIAESRNVLMIGVEYHGLIELTRAAAIEAGVPDPKQS